jgi:hypothetical protein
MRIELRNGANRRTALYLGRTGRFRCELAAEPADAVGLRIRTPVENDDWREVIGVAQSVRDDSLATAKAAIYAL